MRPIREVLLNALLQDVRNMRVLRGYIGVARSRAQWTARLLALGTAVVINEGCF
jgi:hypothetical protein